MVCGEFRICFSPFFASYSVLFFPVWLAVGVLSKYFLTAFFAAPLNSEIHFCVWVKFRN